ncbi:MAG: hypothetical protein WKG01_24250 [Kofleriaceae bacterium]
MASTAWSGTLSSRTARTAPVAGWFANIIPGVAIDEVAGSLGASSAGCT